MNRRKFLKAGFGLAAAGAAMAVPEKAKGRGLRGPLDEIPRVGTQGAPEIPGGEWRPEPGKELGGGPGYNHPRNEFYGALRRGKGPDKDISPVYTYRNIPSEDEVEFKTFHIEIFIDKWEFVKGMWAHLLMFNHQNPGPEIRVTEGDWVKVVFRNRTDLMHTIHWHGLMVPYEMDGVPFATQPPVLPKQQFVYKFRAIPMGTHFYHCHFSTPLHQAHAMHGAFIIESPNDPVPKMFPYTRDYVLVLSSFDTVMARKGLNGMLERMQQRMWMWMNRKLNQRILGVFKNYDQLVDEIDQGFMPAYFTARNWNPGIRPNYNIFTINGKAYPATRHILIKPGEWIRVRLINGSFLEHYMHLHGHDFFEVANDGAPLPYPIRGNTVKVAPGKTTDIVIYGNNPGFWTFHDHDTIRATNNGIYPGGILTFLEYEGFTGGYMPVTATSE